MSGYKYIWIFFLTHFMTIYKTIHVYYLNKARDSLTKLDE